jgi:RND family efflux transporter MFP subunit
MGNDRDQFCGAARERPARSATFLLRMFAWLTLVAVAIELAGCSNKTKDADASALQNLQSVGTFTASRHSFSRTVEFPATVMAAKQVTLMAKVPSDIRKIRVLEGDRVSADQPLIELDQRDFALALNQANAQLAAAQAGVEAATAGNDTASAMYQRGEALHKQDAISADTLDQVQGGQKVAAAQLKAALAQRQLARVGVDAARTNLGYTTIRAPFAGVVARRLVDEGTRIQMMPPTPLLIIADTSVVKVVGGVGERDLPFVGKGTKVEVFVGAIGGEPIQADVDRVEPLVDPLTRTASVYVLIPNGDGRLQTGMSARVVARETPHDAPGVPDDAIVRSELGGNRGVVYIIDSGKARKREVTLGLRDRDLVEIASGLSGGEVIVRGGQDRLHDGQPVRAEALTGAKP